VYFGFPGNKKITRVVNYAGGMVPDGSPTRLNADDVFKCA